MCSDRGLSVVAGSLRFSRLHSELGYNLDGCRFLSPAKRNAIFRFPNGQPSLERNATGSPDSNRSLFGVALAEMRPCPLDAVGTAIVLSTSFVSSSPIGASRTNNIPKQIVPSGPGNDLMGSLMWYPQQPDFLLATVSNNSTTNYAVLAKNNLFDDAHPFNPFSVTTLSGTPVQLVGTRYGYQEITDSQFKFFPPGMVWERYFNMSDFMPPSSSISVPTSQCFAWQLPKAVEALNVDKATSGQGLADLYFSIGLDQVTLDSNPIHFNVTLSPGTPTTGPASAAQTIPAEPSGVFLAPAQQTGSIINLMEGSLASTSASTLSNGNTFEIGSSTASK
ncbi:MAG: hypothetical protein Q9218_006709 [Villophora microphyllina]